jgi:dolichol kinase
MVNEAIMDHQVLKRRSDLHVARKIWHIGMVFAMFLAWVLLPEKISLTILVIAWILFVPVDFLRHSIPALNDWLIHAFRPIMRQNEVHKMAGTTYLLCGVMVVAMLFPRPIVSLTLLFLAFADPLASFIGIRYGRDKIFGHKSLQGFLAAYVVCTVASLIYLLAVNQSSERVVIFSLLAGIVGALAELVPVAKIDDNFTLPVFSALGLYGLFYFFGFLPIAF